MRYEGGCSTVVIGRDASATGRVLIGHNEDDDRSIVQVHSVPRQRHEEGETIAFGDRPDVQIPQVKETAAFIWSEVRRPGGISFGDSFFNEYGVAIVTNSCNPGNAPEDADGSQEAYLQTMGLGYGARRLLAERAKSAREGLDVLIELVETYGYFSSRCYHIADKDECWAVQLTRGKRLVAKRIPDDAVYFIPNHYTIHALEPSDKKNFYYTPDIVEFAIEQGWYTPAKEGDYSDFDFAKAYQKGEDKDYNTMRARNAWPMLGFEAEWAACVAAGNARPFAFKAHRKYTIDDCKALMRTHYEGREDFAGDVRQNEPAGEATQAVTKDPSQASCACASPSTCCGDKAACANESNPAVTKDGWREGSTDALSGSERMAGGALRQDPSGPSAPLYTRDPHQSLDDPRTICCGTTVESTVVDFADDPAATCVYRTWRKPCTNPYVPLFLGAMKVPGFYAWMDEREADETHFAPSAQEFIYNPDTAFWQAENLIWMSELDYGHAHAILAPAIAAIEAGWTKDIEDVRIRYEELKAKDAQLAREYLSAFSDEEARYALYWMQCMTQRIGRSKYLSNQGLPADWDEQI